MLTLEDIINDPDQWHSMVGLDPKVFDALAKQFGSPYYLRLAGSKSVWFGQYDPVRKKFDCLARCCLESKVVDPREVEEFIALPPVEFNYTTKDHIPLPLPT